MAYSVHYIEPSNRIRAVPIKAARRQTLHISADFSVGCHSGGGKRCVKSRKEEAHRNKPQETERRNKSRDISSLLTYP